jgi:hypothetical protein
MYPEAFGGVKKRRLKLTPPPKSVAVFNLE